MSEENAVLAMAGLDVPEETPAEPDPTEVETPEVEAKGEPEPEAQAESPADEPPASTEDAPKGVDPQYAAMLEKANDEKSKRQELQRQLDEQKAQLEALQQKPAPDPLEDPDGFRAHQQEQLTGLKEQFAQELNNAKYDMARLTVMSLKDDYEEVEQVFIEEAKTNPTLARMLGESANPALFAYEQGKKIQALSQDPDEMRKQIEAEVRAKIEAEQKGKTEEQQAQQAKVDNALKPSLATTGNAGLETEAVIDINTVAEMTGEDAVRRKSR